MSSTPSRRVVNLSLVALLLMAVALIGLLGMKSLLARSPVAVVAQVSALCLMVWARATLGRRSFHAGADPTPGGLVTTGPYRFIRHPIYTAACLIGWAGIVSNLSPLAAALGILLLVGAIGRMLCEERLVARVYPEYVRYALTTRRMVPYLF